MVIQNLYTLITGPHMGQGLIVVEQIDDTHFNAIMWPSAKTAVVTTDQLNDPELCALLDTLPDDFFIPYYNAYKKLIERPQYEPKSID